MIKDSKMGCKLTKLTTYPNTCNPEDVLLSLNSNLKNYVHSDIQIFGEYPELYKTFLKNNGIKIKMEENDEEILKENTLTIFLSAIICPEQNQQIQRKKKHLEIR